MAIMSPSERYCRRQQPSANIQQSKLPFAAAMLGVTSFAMLNSFTSELLRAEESTLRTTPSVNLQGLERKKRMNFRAYKDSSITPALEADTAVIRGKMEHIAHDPSNVFDKIIQRQAPGWIVFETDYAIAILSREPEVPGTTLLIPKFETATIFDLPASLAGEIFTYAPALGDAVREATKSPALKIIQNNGVDAGQTVYQMHVHFSPKPSPGSRRLLSQAEGDELVRKIRGELHKRNFFAKPDAFTVPSQNEIKALNREASQ